LKQLIPFAKFRRYYRLVSGAIIDHLDIRFQPTWGGRGSICFEAVYSIRTRRKERKKAYFWKAHKMTVLRITSSFTMGGQGFAISKQ